MGEGGEGPSEVHHHLGRGVRLVLVVLVCAGGAGPASEGVTGGAHCPTINCFVILGYIKFGNFPHVVSCGLMVSCGLLWCC